MVRRETKIMQTIEQCKEKYEHYKASGLKLDMSRGKPAVDQLDLSRALLALPGRMTAVCWRTALTAATTVFLPVCRPCALCSPKFSAFNRKM